jgi:hypothetical protein
VLDVMVHVEPHGQDPLPPLRTPSGETAP